MLDNEACGGEAGFHYSLKYKDGLLRLLWPNRKFGRQGSFA
jgi:hypothetical protein